MSKFFIIFTLPLLLLLPLGSIHQTYLSNQICQMNQMRANSTCSCDKMQEKTSIDKSESCCCIKPGNSKIPNLEFVNKVKPIVLELDLDFEFSSLFQVNRKSIDVETYSFDYTASLSNVEIKDHYYPPIYQQYCSLRI